MDKVFFLNNDSEYINQLRGEFQEKKCIKIFSFMDSSYIELLYKYGLTNKKWVFASGIKNIKYEKENIQRNDKINQNQMKLVQSAFQKNIFSYAFYRCMNNTNPSFIEYQLRQYMNSTLFIDFLNDITGLELKKLTTLFMSKYVSGQFLSPHSDQGNGRLAFVIGLTKYWKPWYGGNLHFLDENREKVIETYTPDFNSLLLFYVPFENGIPHYVSHINPNVPYPRLSITGWYE